MNRITGFLLVTMTLAAWTPSAAQTLLLATDDTPGGYYIVGSGNAFDKEAPGVEIELYRRVAAKLGIELRFQRLSWSRCLSLIQSNQVDGIFPASYSQERSRIGVFPMSGPLVDRTRRTRDNSYYLYKSRSSSLTWDNTRFSGSSGKIGVPRGWAIADDLKQTTPQILETDINPSTPLLLVHQRLEGYICLETVFDDYIRRHPQAISDLVKVQPPVREKSYYLMLSHLFVKTHPRLSERIWDTIKEIKESDWYQDVIHQYIEKGNH